MLQLYPHILVLISQLLRIQANRQRCDSRLKSLTVLSELISALGCAALGSVSTACVVLVSAASVTLSRYFPANRLVMASLLTLQFVLGALNVTSVAEWLGVMSVASYTVALFMLQGAGLRFGVALSYILWLLNSVAIHNGVGAAFSFVQISVLLNGARAIRQSMQPAADQITAQAIEQPCRT